MPLVLLSTTAAEIIDDIVTTLTNATIDTAETTDVDAFRSVGVFDDLEAFRRVADPANAPAAGVIVSPVDRSRNSDNDSVYVDRLAFEIAITVAVKRPPGADDSAGVDACSRAADAARRALVADPSRGGRCALVTFNGQLIAGTEIVGPTRIVRRDPDASFFVIVIPAACAWPEN